MRPLLFLLLFSTLAGAETITVHDGPLTLTGTLHRADAKGPRPVVLVAHEWWGLNAYAERRAAEIADLGYHAVTVDFYGEPASDDFPTAVRRSGPFYQEPARFTARLKQFLDAARALPGFVGQPAAAVGFCFGGSAVLQAARDGLDLRGVVAFHPGLKSTAPATQRPGSRILVCHGGADPFVPPADVAGFISEMTTVGADWRMDIHGSAVHAFTNPRAGQGVSNAPAGVPFAQAVRHDPVAETASLASMRTFLAEILAP